MECVHARLQLGRRRLPLTSFVSDFKASLQQLWVKIGGYFCSAGGWEGFRGEILPALRQICQANQGSRRRSSEILPPVTVAEAELSNKPPGFLLQLHTPAPWKSLQEDSRYVVLAFT